MVTRNPRNSLAYRQWSQVLVGTWGKEVNFAKPLASANRLFRCYPTFLICSLSDKTAFYHWYIQHSQCWVPTRHTGFPGSIAADRKDGTSEYLVWHYLNMKTLKCKWYGWQGFETILGLTHQLFFLVTKYLMYTGYHDSLSRQRERYICQQTCKKKIISNTERGSYFSHRNIRLLLRYSYYEEKLTPKSRYATQTCWQVSKVQALLPATYKTCWEHEEGWLYPVLVSSLLPQWSLVAGPWQRSLKRSGSCKIEQYTSHSYSLALIGSCGIGPSWVPSLPKKGRRGRTEMAETGGRSKIPWLYTEI